MNFYFMALITLYTLSLGIVLAKHGQQQGKYNFFVSLIAVLFEIFLVYNAIRVGF